MDVKLIIISMRWPMRRKMFMIWIVVPGRLSKYKGVTYIIYILIVNTCYSSTVSVQCKVHTFK